MLYITGGVDSMNTPINIVLCYDTKSNHLIKKPSMLKPHSYHTLEYLDNYECIVVIGGDKNYCCEIFDLFTCTWHMLPELTYWRANANVIFNNVTSDTSNSSYSSNIYNPYANMDCAIKLQQQLSETVACMFGIPIYYFKVSGVKDSADITFKEYALKHVTSVKQIKMVIKDGQMPSIRSRSCNLGRSVLISEENIGEECPSTF